MPRGLRGNNVKMKGENLKVRGKNWNVLRTSPESQGQNPALTVLYEPCSLDSGLRVRRTSLQVGPTASRVGLVETLNLSHRMYNLNGFRKSTPPPNRQLIVWIRFRRTNLQVGPAAGRVGLVADLARFWGLHLKATARIRPRMSYMCHFHSTAVGFGVSTISYRHTYNLSF